MRAGVTYAVCSLLCALAVPLTANTIYLVRHAEKQAQGDDPTLSTCGVARANALATYLADTQLAAVYATPYRRTQQTAAAVAQRQQLEVLLYDPAATGVLHQQLKQQTLSVLVVGHSNTVPQLVTLLTGMTVAPLSEQDYSMLYQLQIGVDNSVTLRHQQFSCDAASE